jgi:hypothetical protein
MFLHPVFEVLVKENNTKHQACVNRDEKLMAAVRD